VFDVKINGSVRSEKKKKGLRKRRGFGGILQREPLKIGRREWFCRIVRERENERE
jgi:hypothetical protein